MSTTFLGDQLWFKAKHFNTVFQIIDLDRVGTTWNVNYWALTKVAAKKRRVNRC